MKSFIVRSNGQILFVNKNESQYKYLNARSCDIKWKSNVYTHHTVRELFNSLSF